MSRLLLSHPDAAHCRDPTAASSYPANRRLKSSGIDLAQLVGRVHRHIESDARSIPTASSCGPW